MRIRPGKPYPLGATWDGGGVQFALFSEHAERVDLCLFDSADAKQESARVPLPERTNQIWHGYFPDLRPGQLYGYRVSGPFTPENGHRFNPAKLLLDPYAKAVVRRPEWHESLFGYPLDGRQNDLVQDGHDSGAYAPLGAVIDDAFTWGEDRRPHIPWHQMVIYETHVKGLTRLHPDVPEALRGTYAALTTVPVLQHFRHLGITSVELMPVHQHLDDKVLLDRGLSNYWGYNTLGYFAPHLPYASLQTPQAAVDEFKMMVHALHNAGLEVILDVVYNHTAEGNELGPTLSFRGIDNLSYYRLHNEDRRYYQDFTGTGNTLNAQHPRVLQLIMDSLRYWVQEMHVDGFRFDLASALARELYAVDRLSAFFDIIQQDPVLSQVKLIAEPWDLGEGGYQVGNFPPGWAEWNGRYRDTVRRFWKGDEGTVAEFASRLSGSSDLYEKSGRRPYASINFITSHDGFTLHDLVSYEHKHNEANGEDNRDGDDNNLSWNCGAEGASPDTAVQACRRKQQRNFLATLMLSQGVPMLRGGDELDHSQQGNNNAYCQDNELSWLHWSLAPEQQAVFDFAARVIRLRRKHPVLHRRNFFHGRAIRGGEIKDILWLTPAGEDMPDAAWNDPANHCFAVRLAGDGTVGMEEDGTPAEDRTLLMMFNGQGSPAAFTLPSHLPHEHWACHLATDGSCPEGKTFSGGETFDLPERSLAVFLLTPKG